MSKTTSKPMISGGTTLSKMYQGHKTNGSTPNKVKRKTWRQLDGVSYPVDYREPSGHRLEK